MNPKAEYILGTKFEANTVLEDLFSEEGLLDTIAGALSSSPEEVTTKILETQHGDLMLQYRISPLVLGARINGVIIIIYDFTT